MCKECDFDKCFRLDLDGNGCPKFTKKNISLINAFIYYNSSYSTVGNEEQNEDETAYVAILTKAKENFFEFREYNSLKEIESDPEKIKKRKDVAEDGREKDELYKVVESIDRINSTHLASEGQKKGNKGRVYTANKIREMKEFKNKLEEGVPELVNDIAGAVVGGKYNFSFASKFCAYVSRYALGQDKYCIYDEVVQSILPYYIKKYINVEQSKLPNDVKQYIDSGKYYRKIGGKNSRIESTVSGLKGNYKNYREIINEIINGIKEKDGIEISYKDFDHIIWYYFKGSKVKVQRILNNTFLEKTE